MKAKLYSEVGIQSRLIQAKYGPVQNLGRKKKLVVLVSNPLSYGTLLHRIGCGIRCPANKRCPQAEGADP